MHKPREARHPLATEARGVPSVPHWTATRSVDRLFGISHLLMSLPGFPPVKALMRVLRLHCAEAEKGWKNSTFCLYRRSARTRCSRRTRIVGLDFSKSH